MKTGTDALSRYLVARQYLLDLHAGDALPLCADHGATLCSLDRRLSEAGSALGVKIVLL